MRRIQHSLSAALACAAVLPAQAWATNGYFSHGWGTASKAMAGVATALPQDSLVAATNPAGMAFVGTRFDLALAFFSPDPRGYRARNDFATQTVPATDGNTDFNVTLPASGFISPGRFDSKGDWYTIPSLGFNYQLNEANTIGVVLIANGGMQTDYRNAVWENFAPAPDQRVVGEQPVFATLPAGTPFEQGGRLLIRDGQPVPVTDPFPGSENANPGGVLSANGSTGVNLEQLFVKVPWSYRFGDGRQAVGITPILAMQRFEAKGLQPFRAASVHPDRVTNNGKDTSYGAGVQFGWYGEVSDRLALGLSYQTKIWMSKFDDYKGLFANGGEFDIPAMFNAGLAYRVRPDLTIGIDYQRIFYDEISAISNSNDLDLTPCFGVQPKPSFCLGGNAGLGFGWQGQDVVKLGARWEQSERWTFFGGVSYNSELLKSRQQALFNVLTPATIRWHITAGASVAATPRDRINLSLAYMPMERIDGSSPSITQTQTGSLYMEQKEIEISWSRRF
ncbi:MAG: hydrocarbon degradation protein [Chromatiaceae bacterium]|nr:MAG: hydrocarbon degradation protein [Chromatiaceae bacterium]